EVGDEVDRRGEPERRQREDDLRAERNTPIAEQARKETDEIRQDERELAREDCPTDQDENDCDDDPYRDEDKKDLGPGRKIHVANWRSPAPRVRSGSSRST